MRKVNSIKGEIVARSILIAIGTAGCSILGGDKIDCHSSKFFGYRVTLPPSAGNVQESCTNNVNPTYYASFTMSSNDLTAFEQNWFIQKIKTWQSTAKTDSTFSNEATQAKSLKYGTYSDGAIYEEVLIDTTNPQQYKVDVDLANVD